MNICPSPQECTRTLSLTHNFRDPRPRAFVLQDCSFFPPPPDSAHTAEHLWQREARPALPLCPPGGGAAGGPCLEQPRSIGPTSPAGCSSLSLPLRPSSGAPPVCLTKPHVPGRQNRSKLRGLKRKPTISSAGRNPGWAWRMPARPPAWSQPWGPFGVGPGVCRAAQTRHGVWLTPEESPPSSISPLVALRLPPPGSGPGRGQGLPCREGTDVAAGPVVLGLGEFGPRGPVAEAGDSLGCHTGEGAAGIQRLGPGMLLKALGTAPPPRTIPSLVQASAGCGPGPWSEATGRLPLSREEQGSGV